MEGAAVTVGVVGKPHGVGGEVTVRPDPDIGDEFPPGRVYLAADSQAPLTVASSRMHGSRRLVRFEGVTHRDAAEELRGTVLTVPRSDVARGSDQLWVDELLARPVVNRDGRQLGTVADVTDGEAHDYLVVTRADGQEALVPLVADLVEVGDGTVVVESVPGLLEDTAEGD